MARKFAYQTQSTTDAAQSPSIRRQQQQQQQIQQQKLQQPQQLQHVANA